MSEREREKVTVTFAHNRSNGTYRVTDQRCNLHLIRAGSLKALRKQLLPSVRAEIGDDLQAEFVLQLVQAIGG